MIDNSPCKKFNIFHIISNTKQYIFSSIFLSAFIKELIDNSQSDLHEMFVLTYGTLYEQYKDMFEDLFSSFRNYYHGVELDLEQVMIIMIIIIMIIKNNNNYDDNNDHNNNDNKNNNNYDDNNNKNHNNNYDDNDNKIRIINQK